MKILNFKKWLLGLVAVAATCLQAQTLQVFNQEASFGWYSGNLNYTYFEDPTTNEYIKNGKFTFSFNSANKPDILPKGMTISIVGNYVKGFKNGLWTYTCNFVDYKSGDYYHTGKKSVTCTYVNGRLNGLFTYDYSDKVREWKVTLGGSYWLPFEPTTTRKFTANFKAGKLLGNMSTLAMGTNFKTDMNCAVDDSGYIHGKYKYLDKGYNNETNAEFWHGLRTASFTRDLSTAEITNRFKADSNLINAYKFYFLTDSAEMIDLADRGYSFSEANSFEIYGDEMGYSMKQVLNDEDFCFLHLTGDLSIGKSAEGIIYGYTVSLDKHKPLEETYYWIRYTEKFAAKDYQKALEYLEKISTDNTIALSTAETAMWQSKIDECKSLLK